MVATAFAEILFLQAIFAYTREVEFHFPLDILIFAKGLKTMAYNGPNAVAFAQRQSGRYGDGECWTLVEDAVVGAGGRSSRGLTPNFGPNASYVWGTPVTQAALQPGDALQFTRYSWTQTITTDVTNPDGSGSVDTRTETQTRGAPNHSALVVRSLNSGLVEVIEQNIPTRTGRVQTIALALSAPADSTTTTQTPMAGGNRVTVVTTTHSVSGSVACYRPIGA